MAPAGALGIPAQRGDGVVAMKKGMGWPIGITVLLLATVASNIGVMMLVHDDPSFAIEPDYYRKAVAWDSTQAVARASDALGWSVQSAVIPSVNGVQVLRLRISDAQGLGVDSAEVHGELRYVARANEVQTVRFVATESADRGTYESPVIMTDTGLWELRLVADRGEAHFREIVRLDTSTP